MTTLKPITINKFQLGVGSSPYVGFGAMVNLYTGNAGAISQFPKAVADARSYDGMVRWSVSDILGRNWVLTSRGKLYKDGTLISGNTIDSGTELTGCGLGVCGNYVYVARANRLDLYDMAQETWSNGWKTLYDDYFHSMIVGTDNIIYIANGNTISKHDGAASGSIPTRIPENSTWSASALTLPPGYSARCFTELGINIFIGTISTKAGSEAIIFTWNRLSTVITEEPIRIKEDGVYQIITKNNTVYAVCGSKGTLYSTVGTVANKILSISDYMRSVGDYPIERYTATGTVNTAPSIHPAAINSLNTKILIGLCFVPSVFSDTPYPFGVWAYDLETGAISLLNTTSGNYALSNQSAEIGCIFTDDIGQYEFSWRTGQSGAGTPALAVGNDIVTNAYGVFHSNYEDYFESPVYQVGITDNKRTFNRLTVQLSKPLTTGQGIQVKYRTNTSATWTTLGEFTTVGELSHWFPFSVTCELLQVRVEFKAKGTSPDYSAEVLSVNIQ